MKSFEKLVPKIEKIEKLLTELKKAIKEVELEKDETKEQPKKEKAKYDFVSLRSDFDNLYNAFLERNSVIVNEFVDGKDTSYLKEFCKVNNISLDSKKVSKEKIATEIVKWFTQRKAISKRL